MTWGFYDVTVKVTFCIWKVITSYYPSRHLTSTVSHLMNEFVFVSYGWERVQWGHSDVITIYLPESVNAGPLQTRPIWFSLLIIQSCGADSGCLSLRACKGAKRPVVRKVHGSLDWISVWTGVWALNWVASVRPAVPSHTLCHLLAQWCHGSSVACSVTFQLQLPS